ncbi:MAG: TIGR03013 family PEP-CTERM/XrtA system glycosyltransferase [Planctomycetes bacterium]|nr:TIGR03013 family PEP-CTERM/XrtA system glycosyltransferase [Planctomycetota bacterium]|tara:strand:- start:9004 stop:10398 length:1395 start_codon:yes stop_codon:yes gene_type:complete
MISFRTRRSKHALFMAVDVGIATVSLHLMFIAFSLLGWQTFTFDNFWFSAGALTLTSVMTHLSVGMYESKIRESIRGVFRRGVMSATLAFFTYQLIAQVSGITPHNLTLVTGLLVAVSIQTMWRHWAINLGGIYSSRRRVLFIGAGERAAFVSRRMRRDVDRRGFALWGFVALNSISDDIGKNEKVYELSGSESFDGFISRLEPDVVVLANDRGENIDVKGLLDLKMKGAEVVELEDFIESELGQIAVESMRPEWMLLSKGYRFNRFAFDKLNYLFNALLALTVALLTSPFMLATMLAIYFDDGRRDKAGFLYKQIRVGENGKHFEIIKFRSMGKDAEKNGAQWASANDVRVTRVGKYLRKYRLDELPQLINVLRGDMCFVGPRPERPVFVDELAAQIPMFHYRHCVKPGLTGWAQVEYPYGASTNDSFEKLKFDLYYIKHRSFLLDLFVLIRTVEVVLFGRGR